MTNFVLSIIALALIGNTIMLCDIATSLQTLIDIRTDYEDYMNDANSNLD